MSYIKSYNRFARTQVFRPGGEGKARFQALPQNAGKAVESLREKTRLFKAWKLIKN